MSVSRQRGSMALQPKHAVPVGLAWAPCSHQLSNQPCATRQQQPQVPRAARCQAAPPSFENAPPRRKKQAYFKGGAARRQPSGGGGGAPSGEQRGQGQRQQQLVR